MQKQRIEGAQPRSVVIGMITHDAVIGRVAPRWKLPGLFDAEFLNLIGGWCVQHFEKFNKAPGKAIESYFHEWGEQNEDDDKYESVRRLLSSLSGEYEAHARELNADHLLDVASSLFNKTHITREIQLVQGDLERGEVQKAMTRWQSVQPLELGSDGWIDPFRDRQTIDEVFDKPSEPIVEYKGGMGLFFETVLERDGFLGIMGSAKRGKSHWCKEICWQAISQGRKVAYFEVGDLSRRQVEARIISRAAMRPVRAGRLLYPESLHVEKGKAVVSHDIIEYPRAMTKKEGYTALEKIVGRFDVDECRFRLSVHPNMSINALEIHAIIKRWVRDGWVPDVIAVDYADILAPIKAKETGRDAINTTWGYLRRISQELHCLVITPTQADAGSYECDLLRRKNFSDDRRKFDHVTAMLGINMNDEEKGLGLYRLNWLQRREGDWAETRLCHTAGSLAIAAPAIRSCFPWGER